LLFDDANVILIIIHNNAELLTFAENNIKQLKFTDFGLTEAMNNGLESMGFEDATLIQQQAIPIIIANKDLIACAQTGTGKTAAFLLPILNKLVLEPSERVNTLIVVPTRELALQIDQVLQGFSYFTPVSSIAIYGGNDGTAFESERKALETQANIVIATPGRLLSHLSLGYVDFSSVKHFILDEADRMLDMGFIDDIINISSYLPENKQTLMFSATMPQKIRELTRKLLKDPAQLNIAASKPAEGVSQSAYFAEDKQKIALIKSLLKGKDDLSVLIFTSTKSKAKDLKSELQKLNLNVNAIHSDLEQNEREEVLRSFRNHQLKVLVATNILSRGIDIDDIGLVINYDVPGDAEDYIHRIGRTARAESTGAALTFINRNDLQSFKKIESFLGNQIPKIELPEGIAAIKTEKPSGGFNRHKKPNFRNRDRSRSRN
jgi:superfamily II DNA/RNA helicase